jgi:hypothetical protein
MGFDFSSQSNEHGWDNHVKLALAIYKKLHGDLLVPTAFAVPTNDSIWPEHLWGMKLGHTGRGIRSNGSYKEHRDDLVAMDFNSANQRKKNKPE